MNRLTFVGRAVLVLGVASSCGMPTTQDPELTITSSSEVVTSAERIRVKVRAVDGYGLVGKGAVKLSSSVGALSADTLQLDAFGSVGADFICDPAVESACLSKLQLFAEWTSNGTLVQAKKDLNANVAGSGGGQGGGSGTGGGTGAGGAGGAGGGAGGGSADSGVVIIDTSPPCPAGTPTNHYPQGCCSTALGVGHVCGSTVAYDGMRIRREFQVVGTASKITTDLILKVPSFANGCQNLTYGFEVPLFNMSVMVQNTKTGGGTIDNNGDWFETTGSLVNSLQSTRFTDPISMMDYEQACVQRGIFRTMTLVVNSEIRVPAPDGGVARYIPKIPTPLKASDSYLFVISPP